MPKTKIQSTGICVYCKDEFDKSRMTTHLKHCKQRKTAIAQEKEDEAKLQPSRKSRMLHFLVEGYYQPEYWLHLEVPAWIWLSELDDFLRDIWLECCGHLSEFKIGNIHYANMGEEYSFFGGLGGEQQTQDDPEEEEEEIDDSDDFEEIPKPLPEEQAAETAAWVREKLEMIVTPDMQSEEVALIENILRKSYEANRSTGIEEYTMDVKVGKVFKTGIKASYTYDFGSSTNLQIRVLAEREVDVYELGEDSTEENEDEAGDEHEKLEEVNEEIVDSGDEDEDDVITVMARNIPPAIVCDTCGQPATWISTRGGYDALCNACYKKSFVVVGEDGEEVEEEESDEIDDFFGEGFLPVVNSPRMGVCGYTGR